MAAPRNTRTTHPAMSQQTEAMLGARNITFDFEANVRIEDIRLAEGFQVRYEKHRAPKEQVDKYAVAMKHGAVFPAIVLNEDLERIDGNTRLEARIKNGDEVIPAYICHGLTPLEARSLSIELNQSNGLAMTEDEIRSFVDGAVEDGQSADLRTLARMTGVRDSKIARWIAESQFVARATREGIDQRTIDQLAGTARAALHAARLATVFRAATQLAADAKLKVAEVKKLVSAANGAASEAEALAVISSEREDRSEDIRAHASGFAPRGDFKSKGSAQHLGGLVRFNVDDLLDVAPDKQYDTYQRMTTLRDRLAEVVSRAEREWDLTPPPAPHDDAADVSSTSTSTPAVAG
jgi:hypothetical protein